MVAPRLDLPSSFSPAIATWFAESFDAPTPAQAGAWNAIERGDDTLVVAPTGSGKTLAAFLTAIDRLAAKEPPADRPTGRSAARSDGSRAAGSDRGAVSVLYISPLKALGVDVERNLTSPLVGTARTAERLGLSRAPISVGVRTGDTPPAERRRLATHPPDILITTPESLFLLLTSQAREILRGVETVILDEVHAVAGTKRGVHLALSLARLDAMLETPAQRIGLSATVEPVDEVAAFLTGSGRSREVTVVQPESTKEWEITVSLPVPDLQAIEPPPDAIDDEDVSGTIWPHVERAVLAKVLAHRSTIVFTNSRSQAERLTGKLNRLHARRRAPDADRSADGPSSGSPHAEGSGISGGSRASVGSVASVASVGSVASVASVGSVASEGSGEVDESDGVEDIARAHHGSMSKEVRAQIEDQLKSGTLRCVVATSSLELGIDMGAVDLVLQVAAPMSVSSLLQRVGRSGHDVGAVSTGSLHPLHAADVLRSAVAVQEAVAGRIEPLTVPRNALDVLAQHTVSAAAMDDLQVEDWFDLVRTAHPYRALPRSAFDQTIDLLAGRYPSTAFSELRPRLVHDHDTGVLSARPGAQRLAVTSGGTIPDRGLYPVHLVTGDDDTQPRRVGELDEEMVYESRRGDVITLGTSSWRIEEITASRVTVSPAFGLTGRIPFWHGDGDGRPASLGRAIATAQSELASLDRSEADSRLMGLGLEANARTVLLDHLAEQQQATGAVPGPEQLVVERFLDELGDWRVVLHCAYGQRITGPWALAVGARVEERYGLDGQVMAADDGIVLRIPHGEDPPGADLFVFTPEEIDEEVRRLVGSSALFAARFRECSARALLLPRRDPQQRAPLWQQRQRSSSLLEVARPYPDFPIMLEAARECLQDVYDLPALIDLMTQIGRRRVQVREIETPSPSPFARSLLFGYLAQFIYDADAPLAERRTAALALDQSLLAELLGAVSLRELLDAEVIAEVESRLQGLTAERALRGAEQIADVLRRLGPLTPEDLALRTAEGVELNTELARLHDSRRILTVRIAGREHVAAIEDAGLLRDALGVALPPGVPDAHLAEVDRAVAQLLSRWARGRGPFPASSPVEAFGLAPGVARGALEQLTAERVLQQGEFTPGREGEEWVDAEVLRRIRRASLAASRREIAPVPGPVYARFLGQWQHLVGRRRDGRRERAAWTGRDGLLSVVDQLAGVSLPLSAWESQVLPVRLPDLTSATVDAAFAAGELVWTGHGRLGADDGWIRLHLADALPLGLDIEMLEESAAALAEGSLPSRILALLRAMPGALRHGEILTALADDGGAVHPPDLHEALWDLAFQGLITNDSFDALRSYGRGPATQRSARSSGRSRSLSRRGAARLSAAMMRQGVSSASEVVSGPVGAGRWSAVRVEGVDPAARAAAVATLLLDRHGVVTRGAMDVEDIPGSFAAVYRVLAVLEENGSCRRGYFVEGLGASQFAPVEAVDLLRDREREADSGDSTEDSGGTEGPSSSTSVVALAATDPANPYGAALPWPSLEITPPEGTTVRPARRAGALVLLRDGQVAAVVDKGAKHLLWWTDPSATELISQQLVRAIAEDSRLPQLRIERVNGHPIDSEPVAAISEALVAAGCYRSPKSIRLRAGGR
ncbi:ATP-dependent helicase [Brachybacterium alimentarium]|uniref:ATP-dependent helicase n=2 Tax=Brachybacterium alimentarium TaxID=47845 RepID=UPI000DF4602C|nr:ATP-dependent helicase [Brachybacterium alimentarium]RCS66657.1 ATP-dependent helicase [Brachybacterium alimentarium]RCS77355.1 ATP-dependent helicase [Brachybacterium alimentarium]RCS84706.1 ATP-dependent helicase [Brachybacterium alimentarium]